MSRYTKAPWHLHDMEANTVVGPDHIAIAITDVKSRSPETNAANARLMTASPELLGAGKKVDALVVSSQAILTRYLIPDGLSAEAALGELLGLLDGPLQREAQELWESAVAKAVQS